MIRRPPRSTLFPTRRSSDLYCTPAFLLAAEALLASSPCPTRDAIKQALDRKSTRLNSSHVAISYAVFCLKKKKHEFDRQLHVKQAAQADLDHAAARRMVGQL